MSDDADQPRLEELTDHELMLRLGQGERAALVPLAQRHQAKIVALAGRFLGHRDAAEDVAQDVFVRVIRYAPRFQPQAKFTTWLYRLVANACWDRRRQAVRELRLLTAHSAAPPVEDPSASLERGDRIEAVRRAVAALPDRQRLAVVLHRYQGMSHKEIGEATGWSPGAVESCLVRAYQSLRKSLSDIMLE